MLLVWNFDDGFFERFMGVHESQKEILASAHYCQLNVFWNTHFYDQWLCHCPIYLHSVLIKVTLF